MHRVYVIAALLFIMASAHAEDAWKIANGPLLTPWTKEVSPTNALPEYPRPLFVREKWMNLNGLWDYAVLPKADTKPSSFQGQILVPYPIESALSGVMQPLKPDQRLWYRRQFSAPKEWSGQRLYLHFDAVDWSCEVWLNGKSLGTHRGGYDRFSFEISKALKGDGPQELVVAVLDPTDASWQLRGKQALHPGGAFYTCTSGIWQTVWLEPVPLSALDELKIVTDTKSGVLKLRVSTRTAPEELSIAVTVLDGTKKVAQAESAVNAELTADSKENLKWYKLTARWSASDFEIPITGFKAWSPETPFLYDLLVELKTKDGQVLDSVKSYFGMRTVAVGHQDKNTVLLLNDKRILLSGALDQGFWPDGLYTAPTDAALKFDVEAARKLGLNAIRKHIKVEPERFYYWCDKLGLLVIQDMPSGNDGNSFTDMPASPEASTTCEMERRILIQQRWNHPSIICWALFNEGWGQHDTLRQVEWARQLDPSRLIDEASGFPRQGGGDVLDCHGGIPPRDSKRISLDSETSGYGLTVPGHSWPGKGWATGTYDAQTDAMTKGKYEALYPLDEKAKAWYTKECAHYYSWLPKNGDRTGVSGDFKVQLYDLENEQNGMLSYDRAVWKVDPEQIAAACKGQ